LHIFLILLINFTLMALFKKLYCLQEFEEALDVKDQPKEEVGSVETNLSKGILVACKSISRDIVVNVKLSTLPLFYY